jgi:hypothetical protein
MQTGAVRVSAAFVMRACANTLKDGLRAAIERAGAGRDDYDGRRNSSGAGAWT